MLQLEFDVYVMKTVLLQSVWDNDADDDDDAGSSMISQWIPVRCLRREEVEKDDVE